MEILKILIWPIVAIIIVLLLKKSIQDLLKSIKKIGYGGLSAEVHSKQESTETSLLTQSNEKPGTVTRQLKEHWEYLVRRPLIEQNKL